MVVQQTLKIYETINDVVVFFRDRYMQWSLSVTLCYYSCKVWVFIKLEILDQFVDHVFCWRLSRACLSGFR